jgi:hypothetical protein
METDDEKMFFTHQGAFRWKESDVRKLRAAVLQNVVDTIVRPKRARIVDDIAPVNRTPDRELTTWLQDESPTAPFGFNVCCDDCSLDPDAVRDALHKRHH